MAEKAIFEEIFDGPDSVFGQIFGPGRAKLRQQEKVAASSVQPASEVRIKLGKKHIDLLEAGREVTFVAGSQTIVISSVYGKKA